MRHHVLEQLGHSRVGELHVAMAPLPPLDQEAAGDEPVEVLARGRASNSRVPREIARGPGAAAEERKAEGPSRLIGPQPREAAVGLPSGLAADVEIAAAAYQPHAEADIGAADDAVSRLVEACGGVPDEATAVRISLLVQACAATAALIGSARLRDDLSASVHDLLADNPPIDSPVST